MTYCKRIGSDPRVKTVVEKVVKNCKASDTPKTCMWSKVKDQEEEEEEEDVEELEGKTPKKGHPCATHIGKWCGANKKCVAKGVAWCRMVA